MATEERPLLTEEESARAHERILARRKEWNIRALRELNPDATAEQIDDTAEQLKVPMHELWIMSQGYEISGIFGRHGLKFEERVEPAEPWELEMPEDGLM